MKILLLLLTFLITSALFGDVDRVILNRPAKEFTMQLEKGDRTVRLASTPYFHKGALTIFPGDKLFIEFDIVEDTPKNPRVVKTKLYPERTLELEMTQDKEITMVARESGFTRNLTMKCHFESLDSERKNAANMLPLEKGMGSFDSFDPATWLVVFHDFGFEK